MIIDPVLSYSTYLGGNNDEEAYGVAVDSAGNTYIVGATTSTNFPTMNPHQPNVRGSSDVFITKLNADGQLVYSTYLGGNSPDDGYSLAIDPAGNAYVTGETDSTNFPTLNAFRPSHGGGFEDGFVAKLNANGQLVYSTYLGGNGNDTANEIATDSAGNVYIAGTTDSTNFPTQNAAQPALGGTSVDAFVTKLNVNGQPVYSTYLGGTNSDGAQGIAVDPQGNAYITGNTFSTNFPVRNPFQPTYGGTTGGDAFVTKLDGNGQFSYSSFLGGSASDNGYGIAVDPAGNAYVTGGTGSPNFPTRNPAQANLNGLSNAFVTKVNAGGQQLGYSTFIGGDYIDTGSAIAVDAAGNAYLTGDALSTNFPTRNAFQPVFGGGDFRGDGFVAKLNARGNLRIPLISAAIAMIWAWE